MQSAYEDSTNNSTDSHYSGGLGLSQGVHAGFGPVPQE